MIHAILYTFNSLKIHEIQFTGKWSLWPPGKFFRHNIYIYLESLFHVLSNYPQNFLTQASGENELCSLILKQINQKLEESIF